MRIFILPFFIYCVFKQIERLPPECYAFHGAKFDISSKVSRVLELKPELESNLSHIAGTMIVNIKDIPSLQKIETMLDQLLEGADVLEELRKELSEINLNLGSDKIYMIACLSRAPTLAIIFELLKEMHPQETLDTLLEMSLSSLFNDLDDRLDRYFGAVTVSDKAKEHLRAIKLIDMINPDSRLRYSRDNNMLKVHKHQTNAVFQDQIFDGLGLDVLVIICGFGSRIDRHANSQNLPYLGARYSTSKVFDEYKSKIGFPENGHTRMIVCPKKDEGFFDLAHKELTGSSNICSSTKEYLLFLNWTFTDPWMKDFLFKRYRDISNPQTVIYLSRGKILYTPSSYIAIETPGADDLIFGYGFVYNSSFCIMSGREVLFCFCPLKSIFDMWNWLFEITDTKVPMLTKILDQRNPKNRMIAEYYNSKKGIFDPIHYLAQDKTILIPLVMATLRNKSGYSIAKLLQMSVYDIFAGSHQTLKAFKINPEDKLVDILSPYHDAPPGWTTDAFLAGLVGFFDRIDQEGFSIMFEESKHLIGLNTAKMRYSEDFRVILDPEEYTKYIKWLIKDADQDLQELLKGDVIDTQHNGYYNESRGDVSFTLCGLNRFKHPNNPEIFFGYSLDSMLCYYNGVEYYTELDTQSLHDKIQEIWNKTEQLLPVPRSFVTENGGLAEVWREYNA